MTEPILAMPDSEDMAAPHPRGAVPAFLLSLLTTGLGHLYAGQPAKALRWYLIGLAVVLLMLGLTVWVQPGLETALVMLAFAVAVAVDAARTARRVPPAPRAERYHRWYLYAGIIVVNGLLLQIPRSMTRSRVEAFRIPSSAMEPTLLIGDYLYVGKTRAMREDFHHGSIVVHRSSQDPRVMVVKRVVGLPGDTLSMVANVLIRNGRRVDEPYIKVDSSAEDPAANDFAWQRNYVVSDNPDDYHPTVRTWGPLVVPFGSLFLLGDNRDNSYDSRYTGFVRPDQVVGQPMLIYYSYDKYGPLPLPFLTAVRWDRIRKRF